MKNYQKNRRNKKGWVVKNDRPEEYIGDPYSYYTDDEVKKISILAQ